VDHENHDGLDYRHGNLRLGSQTQNLGNSRKRIGEYSSKYKGVSGRFDSQQDAANAYDRAAHELFGKYAHTNFSAVGDEKP